MLLEVYVHHELATLCPFYGLGDVLCEGFVGFGWAHHEGGHKGSQGGGGEFELGHLEPFHDQLVIDANLFDEQDMEEIVDLFVPLEHIGQFKVRDVLD